MALLLCCVLVATALSGILADEAPPNTTPETEQPPLSEEPKLRLRYSVNDDNALTVRGTFYLSSPSDPVRTCDGLELEVAVLNDASEQVRRESVTVSRGRFTVRFSGLRPGAYTVRVFSEEGSIGRIRGPIRIGDVPVQVSEPTQKPAPTPQEPAPQPATEPTPGPEPEATGGGGPDQGEPKKESKEPGKDKTEPELESEPEPEDEESGDISVMPAVLDFMSDSLSEEPFGFAAANAFLPTAINLLTLQAAQQGKTQRVLFTVTGDQGETVNVTFTPDGATIPPGKTITLPASTPGAATSESGFLDVPAFGTYTIKAEYDDASDSATMQVTVEPPLAIDPISDASPVVAGLTAPGLQVEVTSSNGSTSTTVKAKANFRGAFYIGMPKLQKAGAVVAVSVLYPGGKVTRNVTVRRAQDLPTYANNLSLGQEGPGVKAMQQRLKDLGYDVDVTSVFDKKTHKAVLDFQRINRIAEDGIGGPVTRSLLFSVTAREYTTDAVGTAGVLKYGDKGADVKTLQTALRSLGYYSGSLEGNFGNGTRSAVRAFERRNGLPVDGIADLVMQAALYSGAAVKAGSGFSSTSTTTRSGSSSSGWDAPVATPVPEPEEPPVTAPLMVQPPINEMPVSSGMRFGTADTEAQMMLPQGRLRVETQAEYSLLDMWTPGMYLRASYVDAAGIEIPCRIIFSATVGSFITRDDERSVIGLYSSPYTSYDGEAYWSLTPYFQAMERSGEVSEPAIDRDMISWLDRPLMDAELGRQWRVTVEATTLHGDLMVLGSAELVMILQEDGIVALDTFTMMGEGWMISAQSLGW